MARILLLDDQEIVRYAIGAVLKSQHNMEVVGAAANGAEALAMAAELNPSILLTETMTPDLDGIEAATKVLAQTSGVKAIALTMRQDQSVVTQAMRANFKGYVLKKCPFAQLVDAIKAVEQGQMFLCPEVVGAVISNHVQTDVGGSGSDASEAARISNREREVLQLVAEGLSTKEVADKLGISLKTVETHRRRVMAKLKIFSVAQLTKYAIREGLTTV